MSKPDCFECMNRLPIPGDCHIGCAAIHAKVRGAAVGIRRGWFVWPWNFDPVWLETCDSFRRDAARIAGEGTR